MWEVTGGGWDKKHTFRTYEQASEYVQEMEKLWTRLLPGSSPGQKYAIRKASG